MAARYILPALALLFLLAALWRRLRRGAPVDAAARTWLLVALFFAIVSAWLWHTS